MLLDVQTSKGSLERPIQQLAATLWSLRVSQSQIICSTQKLPSLTLDQRGTQLFQPQRAFKKSLSNQKITWHNIIVYSLSTKTLRD